VSVEEERSDGTEVKVVMEMYRKAETAVQIQGKKTAWFEV